MKLFFVLLLWLVIALAIGYIISFAGKHRLTIRIGLTFIIISFITGLTLMLYAIAMLG